MTKTFCVCKTVLESRALLVPRRGLFVGIACLENRGLVERLARELEADRQACSAETTGQGKSWEAGQVEQWRVNEEVFRHQVKAGRLRPNRSRHDAGCRQHEQVYRFQLPQHLAADLLSDSLGLQIGGGADQDAHGEQEPEVRVIVARPLLQIINMICGG